MKCKTIQLNIDEYLADEMPAKMRNEIERHLSQCEDCRLYMQIVSRIIENAPSVNVAEGNPEWEKVSSRFNRIALEKSASAEKFKSRGLSRFFSSIKPLKATPLLSAASAVAVFFFVVTVSLYLILSSNLIASDNEQFLIKQIKAAESIYEANIQSLNADFESTLKSMPAETAKTVRAANENLQKTIKECDRLAMIQPTDQIIVKKLFESYKMQMSLRKKVLINIKNLEV